MIYVVQVVYIVLQLVSAFSAQTQLSFIDQVIFQSVYHTAPQVFTTMMEFATSVPLIALLATFQSPMDKFFALLASQEGTSSTESAF